MKRKNMSTRNRRTKRNTTIERGTEEIVKAKEEYDRKESRANERYIEKQRERNQKGRKKERKVR